MLFIFTERQLSDPNLHTKAVDESSCMGLSLHTRAHHRTNTPLPPRRPRPYPSGDTWSSSGSIHPFLSIEDTFPNLCIQEHTDSVVIPKSVFKDSPMENTYLQDSKQLHTKNSSDCRTNKSENGFSPIALFESGVYSSGKPEDIQNTEDIGGDIVVNLPVEPDEVWHDGLSNPSGSSTVLCTQTYSLQEAASCMSSDSSSNSSLNVEPDQQVCLQPSASERRRRWRKPSGSNYHSNVYSDSDTKSRTDKKDNSSTSQSSSFGQDVNYPAPAASGGTHTLPSTGGSNDISPYFWTSIELNPSCNDVHDAYSSSSSSSFPHSPMPCHKEFNTHIHMDGTVL